MNNIQQTGGGPCDDVFNEFNPCDIITPVIRTILEYIVEKPIHAIIDIINFYIRRINDLVWLILNYIVTVFGTILSILNGPIAAVNILTIELKELLNLSINLLSGDLLSIVVVYTLPLLLYYKTFIFRSIDMIILPFQKIFKSIFALLGITVNSGVNLSLSHLIAFAKYIIIFIYIICYYGFIELIF